VNLGRACPGDALRNAARQDGAARNADTPQSPPARPTTIPTCGTGNLRDPRLQPVAEPPRSAPNPAQAALRRLRRPQAQRAQAPKHQMAPPRLA
jgi:hypothetical protein